jgi:cell division protein FtsI (penicillin-binding protein 3)
MKAVPTVFQRRIVIGAVICVLAFALVGARLIDVTLFIPDAKVGKSGMVGEVSRGDLVDRNGELVARDLPADDLYARPHLFPDPRLAARRLASVTGADERRLMQMFTSKRGYVLVARQLSPEVRAEVQRLGLPGLDGNGVSGLELGLDPQLRGERPGEPVQTSLDTRVQFVLAHEAAASMKEFSAQAAGGLVMDVRSGEILALVSLPDFDPNARVFATGHPPRNIMAQDVYELGSVFKIFSFTLALEDHTIPDLDERIPIGNGFKIGKYTIHEAEHMPATLAVREVLAQSSNIGTAEIALRSGPSRQRAFVTRMGLLSPVRSELPETAHPLYPSNWGQVETATIGFGHGISVSPLAFAAAAAAVVNGGRRIVPTFLKHPADARGEQLISPATSRAMRELLRYVVTDGTGTKADAPGYDVGGKTGSAEKVGPHGKYTHKLITSFCAMFPSDEPRYLVFVLLDEPHGTKATSGFALAGYTAAPLAGHVISRIAPLLGVPMKPVAAAEENS